MDFRPAQIGFILTICYNIISPTAIININTINVNDFIINAVWQSPREQDEDHPEISENINKGENNTEQYDGRETFCHFLCSHGGLGLRALETHFSNNKLFFCV